MVNNLVTFALCGQAHTRFSLSPLWSLCFSVDLQNLSLRKMSLGALLLGVDIFIIVVSLWWAAAFTDMQSPSFLLWLFCVCSLQTPQLVCGFHSLERPPSFDFWWSVFLGGNRPLALVSESRQPIPCLSAGVLRPFTCKAALEKGFSLIV